jgi:hypothetical protein
MSCVKCGHGIYDATTLTEARKSCEELVARRGEDPYLRSATLLGYTLRSRVRGFLDDDSHPFVRDLVRFLERLVEVGGDGALTQLIPHAESNWIEPHSPLLARAIRTLRERRETEFRSGP